MGCERYREALSARLDGEDEGLAAADVDRHLARCAECRAWLDTAAMVTRLARTAPVEDEPPATVDAAPGRTRGRVTLGLRIALATVGFAQFLLGAAQIAGVGAAAHVHVDGAGHLWNESAAWNLALGAGFAFVAFRRTRPSGLVPMLTAFVVVLVLLSAGDTLAGEVGGGRLASHALLVVGYLITVALSRPTLDPGEPPSSRGWRWRATFAPPAEPPKLRVIRGDGPLAGHARAADQAEAA